MKPAGCSFLQLYEHFPSVESDNPADLPERDYSRYLGYWHGITFMVFDRENREAWILSDYWVSVAGFENESDGSPDEPA